MLEAFVHEFVGLDDMAQVPYFVHAWHGLVENNPVGFGEVLLGWLPNPSKDPQKYAAVALLTFSGRLPFARSDTVCHRQGRHVLIGPHEVFTVHAPASVWFAWDG